MMKLGLIINPIAGMGGRVGLKGSDGSEILKMAQELGAIPESHSKALIALKEIVSVKEEIELWTAPGVMGENYARIAGFEPHVIGTIAQGETTSEDTRKIAGKMAEIGIDLLLFAGGDGTARDVYAAIGTQVTCLGIPAGVKIHSAVYAVNPKSAGKAAVLFLRQKGLVIQEAEVMDIDEEAFRKDRVQAKLYGYLKVPKLKEYMQNVKSGGYSEKESLAGLSAEIADKMADNTLYIIGPGTTTRSIMERLGLKKTLLGVDVVWNKQVIANDVNEKQLYELLSDKRTKIIVTVIGGQGHIFGRGNHQISPRVIRKVGKDNIMVVASKGKLVNLIPAPLLVDTGDPELDHELSGFIRVITGFEDYVPYQVGT
ncbi:MAG: ATP-NAD kinase family protein [Dehalobacterium sp.]